jgi:hypothetical protein
MFGRKNFTALFSILVKGHFVTVMRAFLSEAILRKLRDCLGKKRLAMTHIPTPNPDKPEPSFTTKVTKFTKKNLCVLCAFVV